MQPPKRIVSLVPSDTYTLLRLGAAERLVGRTRYCVEPAAEVAGIPEVGGTKDPDLFGILELAPDLVIMNEEENTRPFYERLQQEGVTVLTSIQKTMTDGLAQVGRLGRLLGDLSSEAKDRVRAAYAACGEATVVRERPAEVRVFAPIWMSPLMTIHGDTFLSDVLRCAGAENVFSDRERKFPLAADLGRARPMPLHETIGRDKRYPRVTLEEVQERSPELVLLPDEPHPFSASDAQVFRDLKIPSLHDENVRLCSGKALLWPGLMSLENHEHVRGLIVAAARIASASTQR